MLLSARVAKVLAMAVPAVVEAFDQQLQLLLLRRQEEETAAWNGLRKARQHLGGGELEEVLVLSPLSSGLVPGVGTINCNIALCFAFDVCVCMRVHAFVHSMEERQRANSLITSCYRRFLPF